MKTAGYILLFYLVLLSVVPCCAFDNCADEKISTEQAGQHGSGNDDCGNCSPFFNCEGCATATINVTMISFDLYSPERKSVYVDLISSPVSSPQHDFWQPPRKECKI